MRAMSSIEPPLSCFSSCEPFSISPRRTLQKYRSRSSTHQIRNLVITGTPAPVEAGFLGLTAGKEVLRKTQPGLPKSIPLPSPYCCVDPPALGAPRPGVAPMSLIVDPNGIDVHGNYLA